MTLTVALSPEPLRQEEVGEPDINQNAFIKRLAQNPSNEAIPVELGLFPRVGVRVRIQLLLLSGEPQASISVEDLLR